MLRRYTQSFNEEANIILENSKEGQSKEIAMSAVPSLNLIE